MNNTLVNGMALLEVLAHSDRALGVSELAARVDLGKSNAHRLLQTLTELGYVRRDAATGTYAAAIRLWELGTAMLGHLDLRQLALPAMEALLARTRESVHLSVLDGDEVVYLHKLESPEPVRAYSAIGGRAPARCVATGKAMLAALNEAALGALAENLHAHTPKSITDATAFLQEMAGIRTRGYAVNAGEWQETVCGVAAPIHDPAGGVIAAIGVSGPAERLRPGRFKALGVEVTEAAGAVERALAGGAAPLTPFNPCAVGAATSSPLPASGRPPPQQQEEKRRASE
ncbi:IclR family transcriptional regulator [Thalassospiraceae bacterium LMO-SO8]|nr:IclR family transcriptional regulator [Alphaproteobacteria bacterium LMO-S08]WND76472.1 IclR family transcriptional regulator [Thalassospiraceae bacterium LMO-SO8]